MTTKKKIIGCPGWAVGENSFGVTKNYLEWMSQFGDARIIMPWEDVVDVDLILLPGGLDVSPSSYGETPRYHTSNQDVFKTHFFEKKLDGYIEKGIPVFGICLGMQMLAVKYGSKLTQDLMFHTQSKDRWAEAHPLINASSKKETKLKVNCHHHQGVLLGDLSEELEATYLSANEDYGVVSDEQFIVEVFLHRTKLIAGVQYHPEELYDIISKGIVTTLLEAKEARQANG